MNRGWALALLLLWGGCGDGETTLSPLDAGGMPRSTAGSPTRPRTRAPQRCGAR